MHVNATVEATKKWGEIGHYCDLALTTSVGCFNTVYNNTNNSFYSEGPFKHMIKTTATAYHQWLRSRMRAWGTTEIQMMLSGWLVGGLKMKEGAERHALCLPLWATKYKPVFQLTWTQTHWGLHTVPPMRDHTSVRSSQ